MSETSHEDLVVIINSNAKGNFKRIRQITEFLNKYDLHAVVNGEVNTDLPPVIIEVHIFNQNKKYFIPQLENFLKNTQLSETVKINIIDQDDMPSFSDMAASFGSALFSTGKQLLKKTVDSRTNIFITAEQKAERLEICNNCPYYNHQQKRCRKCGCKMVYKTQLKVSKCPMNLWPDVT